MVATLQGYIENNRVVVKEADIRRYNGSQVLVVVQNETIKGSGASTKKKEYLEKMRGKPFAGEERSKDIDKYIMEMRNDRE